MREIIAKIKLMPGQVGFFDPLTNIHLTITSPVGYIYHGMNTSGIKRSVNSKRIEVIEGSLNPEEIQKVIEKTQVVKKAETEVKVEKKVEPISETPTVESSVEEKEVESKKNKKKTKKETE